MPSTSEYEENVNGTPEILFGGVKDLNEWITDLIPDVFSKGDRVQGDGEAGSVYQYQCHQEDEPFGGAPDIKIVIEEYNPQSLSCVVNFQGHPSYSDLKHQVEFFAGTQPDTTMIKWRISYEPYDEATGAPDDLVRYNLVRVGFTNLAGFLSGEYQPPEKW